LVVDAAEIRTGDIIGEGQEVWCTVMSNEAVTIFWGMPPANTLLQGGKMDKEHRLIFKTTDKVSVLR
jgi:hypothetical protein